MDPATAVLLLAMNVSIHFDHMQTLQAANGKSIIVNGEEMHYYEKNPIMGEYPSRGKINRFFFASHAFNTGMVLILPKKIGWGWAIGVTVIETGYIRRNRAIGLQIKF